MKKLLRSGWFVGGVVLALLTIGVIASSNDGTKKIAESMSPPPPPSTAPIEKPPAPEVDGHWVFGAGPGLAAVLSAESQAASAAQQAELDAHVFTEDERAGIAVILEGQMEKAGEEMSIRSLGPHFTTIRMQWDHCGELALYGLLHGEPGSTKNLHNALKRMGFRRVECTNGFDGKASINL